MTYLSLYGIRSELAVIAAVPGDDEGLPFANLSSNSR